PRRVRGWVVKPPPRSRRDDIRVAADLRAVIERARTAGKSTKPDMSRSAGLHGVADVLLGVAHEVLAAYDEQCAGVVNWRLCRDDAVRISSVAEWGKHEARTWDWEQAPEIAPALRSGRPVEERKPNSDEMRPIEGMPARPRPPKCPRRGPAELPVGFPKLSTSWSEMATEFLNTRRGARGGGEDARGID